MGNSRNITDTNSRLLKSLTGISETVYDNKNVDVQISNAVTENMLTTARLLKYYPSLNKCKVRLDNDGSEVFCTIMLLMGGDVMFLYTPSGDRVYCDELHEPCVIPRGLTRVFVAPLNNQKEWIMLGYYFPNELVGFNPSKQGNFKILAFGSLGEYSIRFGMSGLQIVNNGEIVKQEINDWGEDVSTEFYTREDMDKLLKKYEDRIKVLEEKLGIQTQDTDTGDDTTTNNNSNDTGTGDNNSNSNTGEGTGDTTNNNTTNNTNTGDGNGNG